MQMNKDWRWKGKDGRKRKSDLREKGHREQKERRRSSASAEHSISNRGTPAAAELREIKSLTDDSDNILTIL